MAKPLSPIKYALSQMEAGKFPNINIWGVAGNFWLADNDWNLLAGLGFNSRDDAIKARSVALDKASKKFWRNQQ